MIIFLFFGYQKWFNYEAQVLIPYISNGPLLSWMYPVFGIRGATWFLGVAEWSFGGLLLAGFWKVLSQAQYRFDRSLAKMALAKLVGQIREKTH